MYNFVSFLFIWKFLFRTSLSMCHLFHINFSMDNLPFKPVCVLKVKSCNDEDEAL